MQNLSSKDEIEYILKVTYSNKLVVFRIYL